MFFAKNPIQCMSIRTIHDFSIDIISEFVLLCNRCKKPYVDFLITEVLNSKISVHSTGAASPG